MHESLTSQEKSLLLYCESRAVDNRGALHQQNLNPADFELLKTWNEAGYVKFGRIASHSKTVDGSRHWCELSEEAWRDAHLERKLRAKRMSEKRLWETTEEARAATPI